MALLIFRKRLSISDAFEPSPEIAKNIEDEEANESSSSVVKERSKHPPGSDGGVGEDNNEFTAAGQAVSEYAVPRVSHYDEIKPGNTETPTDLSDELRWSQELPNDQNYKASSHDSCNSSSAQASELPDGSPAGTSERTSENETSDESSSHDNTTAAMNGSTVVAVAVGQDNVDAVKASALQQTIAQETDKAKRIPPPVKPKSFKKAPPPAVAPKPKPGGHKTGKIELDSTG